MSLHVSRAQARQNPSGEFAGGKELRRRQHGAGCVHTLQDPTPQYATPKLLMSPKPRTEPVNPKPGTQPVNPKSSKPVSVESYLRHVSIRFGVYPSDHADTVAVAVTAVNSNQDATMNDEALSLLERFAAVPMVMSRSPACRYQRPAPIWKRLSFYYFSIKTSHLGVNDLGSDEGLMVASD